MALALCSSQSTVAKGLHIEGYGRHFDVPAHLWGSPSQQKRMLVVGRRKGWGQLSKYQDATILA